MNRPLVFAALGAVAVGAGSFLPAIQIAVYGEVRYWDVARTQALILLCAATVQMLCAWRGERIGLIACAVAMWGALAWPVLRGLLFPPEEGNALVEAARRVGSAAKEMATDVVWNFSDLSWGMIVLLVGCVLASFAALARPSE